MEATADASGGPAPLGYRPALDGLRAVALLSARFVERPFLERKSRRTERPVLLPSSDVAA